MDITKIQSSEDFAKLTPEEKKEYVRELIHAKAAGITAAFHNPTTHERMSVDELVEELGEEKVVEMISEALEGVPMETMSVSSDDFHKLMQKEKLGTITETEEAMLNFLKEQMMFEPPVQFERTLIGFLCELIEYGQVEQNFNARYVDIIAAMQAFLYVSMRLDGEHNLLGALRDMDVEAMREIETQLSADILNTWKASCTQEVSPALTLLGLLNAASMVAKDMGLELPNGHILNATMNPTFGMPDEDDDEDTNCSNTPPNVCKPATYNAEDAEMRDLLKD
jgi:hypothetical protein